MQNTRFFKNNKAFGAILISFSILFSTNSFSHSGGSHTDNEVNVYSGRKGKLIQPMLDLSLIHI